MKEFIDKLIERLEEKKSEHLHDEEVTQGLGKINLASFCSAKARALDGAIEIVNELAEEYKDKDVNGDLISRRELIEKVQIYFSENRIHQNDLAEVIVNLPTVHNNGWILCSERLPQVETEVYIVAKRKYRGGTVRYITTTAMYEDGTVRENDSCWRWEDIEGEWDEDEDCIIIPEGWWEYRHYNPDDVYNNAVDDEVIAWMPLPTHPAPYTEGE